MGKGDSITAYYLDKLYEPLCNIINSYFEKILRISLYLSRFFMKTYWGSFLVTILCLTIFVAIPFYIILNLVFYGITTLSAGNDLFFYMNDNINISLFILAFLAFSSLAFYTTILSILSFVGSIIPYNMWSSHLKLVRNADIARYEVRRLFTRFKNIISLIVLNVAFMQYWSSRIFFIKTIAYLYNNLLYMTFFVLAIGFLLLAVAFTAIYVFVKLRSFYIKIIELGDKELAEASKFLKHTLILLNGLSLLSMLHFVILIVLLVIVRSDWVLTILRIIVVILLFKILYFSIKSFIRFNEYLIKELYAPAPLDISILRIRGCNSDCVKYFQVLYNTIIKGDT